MRHPWSSLNYPIAILNCSFFFLCFLRRSLFVACWHHSMFLRVTSMVQIFRSFFFFFFFEKQTHTPTRESERDFNTTYILIFKKGKKYIGQNLFTCLFLSLIKFSYINVRLSINNIIFLKIIKFNLVIY